MSLLGKDAVLSLKGLFLSGGLNMNGHRITELPPSSGPNDPVSKQELDDALIGVVGGELVAISGDDTTPGLLDGKLVGGANIVLTVLNPGANESLSISTSSAVSSGATGALQFSDGAGGFSADATNLFWDDTDNQLKLGAGTETLPSSSYVADPDTGRWNPAANELAWSVGGSEAMRLNTLGQLQLGPGSAAAPALEVNLGDGIYSSAAGALSFATLGGLRMTLSLASLVLNAGGSTFLVSSIAGGLKLAAAGGGKGSLTLAETFTLVGGVEVGNALPDVSVVAGRNAWASATGANRVGGILRLYGGAETTTSGVGDGNIELAYDGVDARGKVAIGHGDPSAELDVLGTTNLGKSPVAGTDPGTTTLADFFDYVSKDILVSVGTAAASFDVGFDIPADAMVIGVAVNIQSALTGASGATAIGIGTTGNEAKYGETSTLALDSKATNSIGGMVALAGADDVKVFATDGAGSPTGTIAGGDSDDVRIRIVYATMKALPNA